MKQHDILRRFVFEGLGVRGEWVRLESSFGAAKQHQQGNANVQQLLGEALAAVTLLSATIKFNGSLILQAQGDGDLKTLVVQSTHDRQIRGLVIGNPDIETGSLPQLFGEGYIVLTIKSADAEPYQGVVPLTGNTLAEAIKTYFERSEQLPTRLWLFANETHAAGLLLQVLPAENDKAATEDWTRIEMLANTVTPQELLSLSCEDMLYRLFHEDTVTLFESEDVNFACTCSAQKIEESLYSLGREELEAILAQHPQIEVDCEFCGHHYSFDKVDIERLLLAGTIPVDRDLTRH